ncbi:hypothetical protein IEQ34_009920 [Dendrobium chrysotoxum]|uniref:Uncharacterized protein n=1 Tax=Dendrobium chrysotoxum TaxID=161865 RepID=A0AAV7GKF2_DENCH|nr:hypothetical protein IEQ34_009920 [Dendrobium chrysotoxum]
MLFSVTRKSSGFVTPAEPTPTETLSLSAIDRVHGLRNPVQSIHVFKSGEQLKAAKTIKEAVSKALVHYYPFGGRFVNDEVDGEVKVACRGEGAWFVEAVAECRLEDVRFLEPPLMISKAELLPVTEFACGGFAVGLITVHTIADGLGAAQFLNAIGEMARGLPEPTITPIWARDLIPNPPKLRRPGPPPVLPTSKLQYTTIDIPHDSIQQLKADFFHSTGHYCSSFDAVIAKTWQARTRAVGSFEPDEPVHLCFFASTRHLLANVLPQAGGFYGNCFYPVTVTSTAGRVAEANLADVVRIIRNGKSGLLNEFEKWTVGGLKEDPYTLNNGYNYLFVSDWTKLGFSEVDYGWGTPVNVIPVAFDDSVAVALIGGLPAAEHGRRITTQCVKEEHLEAFQYQLGSLACNNSSK